MIYNILKKNSLLYVHIPFLFYFILLTILLLMPAAKLPEVIEISDKIKHFIAFLVLSFLFSLSCHFSSKYKLQLKRLFILVGLVASFYGGVTEIIQIYVPGRSGDFYDLSLDILGVITGIYLFYSFIKVSKIKLERVGTKK